ncbi:hypothetical protein [Thermomicrobium sp.]
MSARCSDQLASAFAQRFRVLARALDRLDRLEGERAFAGWLDQLIEQPRVLRDASEALVLQALRAASDPMNLALLRHLSVEEATVLADLAAVLPLERIALHVRLGELAQAGLVALELEREAARLTELGNALLDWLDELIRCTLDQIGAWLDLVRSAQS